ncbi:NOP5/NOP56 family protein [Candidatus Aenigmatarchaeota archaeon]
MRAFVGTCFAGSFAFDQDGKMIDKELFPKKIDVIVEKIRKSRAGEVLPEEEKIVQRLVKKGIMEIVWDKTADIKGMSCVCKKDNLANEILQSQFRKLAMDSKWASSQAEINEIMSKVQVELTKKELKKEKKDVMVMRVIAIIDEMDRELNTLSELLREWYGMHFPEMSREVGSNERFADLVAKHGERDSIDDKKLKSIAEKSSGMPFSDNDVKNVQEFSKVMTLLFEEKKKLTKYLEIISKETMPNLSAVAGPILAARLLALAGGLERISRLPSSTIQLLGAEKALFRHLRGEGKAPKYGVIFGHGFVQNAPKELKGKVARAVAAKLTLAARIDRYSDRDNGDQMRKELEEQVKKIESRKD